MPAIPKIPKPGITRISTRTRTTPTPTRMMSSAPASPISRCAPKKSASEISPAVPARPNPADLISTRSPRKPSDRRKGAITGLVKKRTIRSAQLTVASVTSVAGSSSASSTPSQSATAVA